MRKQLFAIDGLFCGGCARGLERRIAALDGVVEAGVHFLTASALVRWEPGRCDQARIAACVAEAGYRLVERSDLRETQAKLASLGRALALRLTIAVFFGMWTMGAALILYVQPDLAADDAWWVAVASGVFAIPTIGWAGASILDMAWRSLRLRSYNIDLLIGISVAGSVLLSLAALARGSNHVYFDAATMLVTLRLVGQWIETRVRADAVAAVRALEAAVPERAQREGEVGTVAVDTLAIGDRVTIDAGSSITVDGTVVAGESTLDRSFLTGESAAIPVAAGTAVQAGSINLSRRLVVVVERLAGDREIDRMGGRVAIELAARGERRSGEDRLIALLVAATPVIAFAALALGIWQTGGVFGGLSNALAAAIVICPCAITIARPLAALRAIRQASVRHLRIADPDALDALAELRAAVFDKTGTLTMGRLEVDTVTPSPKHHAAEVLEMAALAETGIAHPIARAVRDAVGDRGDGGVREARGAYVFDAAGRRIEVRTADDVADAAGPVIEVRREGDIVGTVALRDVADPAAAPMLASLRRAGVALRIATGDAAAPAARIAQDTGLAPAEVTYDCTPLAKAELVRTLPRPVLFVGDGINDAPAMAAADCSVSVARAHGAATAIASVAILKGGLAPIGDAIRIARDHRSISRQNAVLAIAYNAVVIPLALAGAMTPLTAALAMTASSLMVSANALLGGKRV
ncbi:heavy metal translocating P-type ATPase [Stakelama marina]|uniref:Cation-translocating P-type ATPase n=1 Tax=Stakelama marina TaxID=2826939 RepID=A0A8T4ID72_9SPHN|nr:HAD-IC family P-type ATPase [Stakelama marina]MBR0552597.1 cation-translocating P-type ATPase [Stakelama marina]